MCETKKPGPCNKLRYSMADESKHYEQFNQLDNIKKWQHEQVERWNYKVSVKLCSAAVIIQFERVFVTSSVRHITAPLVCTSSCNLIFNSSFMCGSFTEHRVELSLVVALVVGASVLVPALDSFDILLYHTEFSVYVVPSGNLADSSFLIWSTDGGRNTMFRSTVLVRALLLKLWRSLDMPSSS